MLQSTVTIKSKQKQTSQHKNFSGWCLGPRYPLGSTRLHFPSGCCALSVGSGKLHPATAAVLHSQAAFVCSALLTTLLSSRVPHSSPLSSKHSEDFAAQTSNTTTVLPKPHSQVYHSNNPTT